MIKFFTKRMNNKKGFTLIELIVVIAILGILIAIAVPRFAGFRERAAERADNATMATIENAARMYYLDNPTASDISIQNLINAKLLESGKDYKPQLEPDKIFKITASDGEITVSVATE